VRRRFSVLISLNVVGHFEGLLGTDVQLPMKNIIGMQVLESLQELFCKAFDCSSKSTCISAQIEKRSLGTFVKGEQDIPVINQRSQILSH
jgi:hypothetical protein